MLILMTKTVMWKLFNMDSILLIMKHILLNQCFPSAEMAIEVTLETWRLRFCLHFVRNTAAQALNIAQRIIFEYLSKALKMRNKMLSL